MQNKYIKMWETRRKNGNVEPYNKTKCPDVDKLKDLYENKKHGSHFIATVFGVNNKLVLRWLSAEGVQIRNYKQARQHSNTGFKQGKDNALWKGEKVGYGALHAWVKRNLGKPSKCEHCGTEKAKRFEWANKSKKYKRDLSDWVRLCTPCHRKFDRQ